MSKFSNIFRALREKSGLSQEELGKALGMSRSAVGMYEQERRVPDLETLERIADYFNITISELTGNVKSSAVSDAPTEYHRIKMVKIPLLGTVAAGIPISAIEDIQGYVEIPERWTHSGEYFALTIKGDSMFPDIHDGDIVIVKSQPVADNNDIVIASVNGDEATCKRLKRYETELCLVPINPDYETMRFTPQEVNTLPVSVLGKVIELRRKYE